MKRWLVVAFLLIATTCYAWDFGNINVKGEMNVTGNSTFAGKVALGNSTGTAGQVFTSQGASSAPQWNNVTSSIGWNLVETVNFNNDTQKTINLTTEKQYVLYFKNLTYWLHGGTASSIRVYVNGDTGGSNYGWYTSEYVLGANSNTSRCNGALGGQTGGIYLMDGTQKDGGWYKGYWYIDTSPLPYPIGATTYNLTMECNNYVFTNSTAVGTMRQGYGTGFYHGPAPITNITIRPFPTANSEAYTGEVTLWEIKKQ